MKIELIIQDNASGMIYDISELVDGPITWETSLLNQPGKLTFNYIDDNKVNIHEGSVISFKVDGVGLFFGYVFKRGITDEEKIPITAYDQLRYLKNKDIKTFSNMTASQIFTSICAEANLKTRIVEDNSYIVAPYRHDSKTLFEMIQHGIDETLSNTGNWYIVKDNFGILEYIHVNSLKTDLVIGDGSLLNNFDYESSIDDDTYNQVQLIKENKETKKRERFIVKDSNSIKNWGMLQYFEKVDENANAAQIQAKGEMLLKLKNRVTKTLKINSLGSLKVAAGSGIVLSISKLSKEGISDNQYFMVRNCTHEFENNLHTMQLDMVVSI